MWQPAGTHSSRQLADLTAMQSHLLKDLAALNQQLTRMVAQVKELNDKAAEVQSILDGRPV